jgi:predicted kinase
VLPPLVLTGGPAAGKSATAGLLARSRPRAAVVDVDDIRQLVVSGAAAPWQGEEGRRQQHLGVKNGCHLARRFLDYAIDVVIADLVSADTLPLYRRLLPDAVVVHLQVSLEEARRRAATRSVYLTDEEFEALHFGDRTRPPAADHQLDVTDLTLEQQVDAAAHLWHVFP